MTRGHTPGAVIIDELHEWDGMDALRLRARLYAGVRTTPVPLPVLSTDPGVLSWVAPAQALADSVRPYVTSDELVDVARRVSETTTASLGEVLEAFGRTQRAIADAEERMTRFRDDVLSRFGVEVYPHPRLSHVGVLRASDLDRLTEEVMNDPRLDAIGRGYYLGMGGAVVLQAGPDWTFSPVSVSLARLYAVAVHRPMGRVARALTCLLSLHTPGSCRPRG